MVLFHSDRYLTFSLEDFKSILFGTVHFYVGVNLREY